MPSHFIIINKGPICRMKLIINLVSRVFMRIKQDRRCLKSVRPKEGAIIWEVSGTASGLMLSQRVHFSFSCCLLVSPISLSAEFWSRVGKQRARILRILLDGLQNLRAPLELPSIFFDLEACLSP